jgi:hypothetical protein
MQLQVITPDGIRFLHDLQVGSLVLCDIGEYLPVKSIAVTVDFATYIRLSDAVGFDVSSRTKVLVLLPDATPVFKFPELYDVLPTSIKYQPQIVQSAKTKTIRFLYDILIDGNMISPEGVIFKFGD